MMNYYINCVTCNNAIRERIFDSSFLPNLFITLSAFIILAIIVGVLSFISTRHYRVMTEAYANDKFLNPVPFSSAAIVLGIGLGGFMDGIIFHQILQWHQLISNKLPPVNFIDKSVNMFWDGIFHLFSLIVVFVGIVLFWKLFRRKNINKSGFILMGGLLTGWGLFNIVEGLIDHLLLKLHNVREITAFPELWNYGFLLFSLMMAILGYSLIRKSEKQSSEKVKNTIFG